MGVHPKPLRYKGVQFHFHFPSEHTFQKKSHAIELHIVHKLLDSSIKGTKKYKNDHAVLAVYFDYGEESEFIKSLDLEGLRPTNINLQKFISQIDHRNIFHYSGSLTTPPCSEIVNW